MTDVESSRLPRTEKSATTEELQEYVRTNVIRTIVVLVVLFGGLLIVGTVFEDELLAVAEAIYETIGVFGLLAVLFVTDTLISPLPPDVVLVVIANSELHQRWFSLILSIGILSAIAGNVGWAIGYRFAQFPWANGWISNLRDKYARQIQRFDRWAIALGALTPLPFSVICITSGALGMRWKRVAPITLLRIVRFFLVYAVIASSAAQ
jgi:membrane protein YqaA with SNARE-associated domain